MKGVLNMGHLEKEVLRMELQISELIRMAANLNERIKTLENGNEQKRYTQKIQVGQRAKWKNSRIKLLGINLFVIFQKKELKEVHLWAQFTLSKGQ